MAAADAMDGGGGCGEGNGSTMVGSGEWPVGRGTGIGGLAPTLGEGVRMGVVHAGGSHEMRGRVGRRLAPAHVSSRGVGGSWIAPARGYGGRRW